MAPLVVRSLVDALADELRERLFTELAPGAVVGESEVARRYEVARPTAKAAIERLVQEGLLRRDAHRSAKIPLLGADDVADLYFARTCVESAAMRRLAVTAVAPPAAADAIQQLAQAAKGPTTSSLVEPDIRFHRALVDALGSVRLSRVHAGIMSEMRLCMTQVQAHHLLDPAIIVAEHEAILAAVAAGSQDRAAAELEAHLSRACGVLVDDVRARNP